MALAPTYIVVLFSVIVQGGTVERMLDRAKAHGAT
jgi:CPA1 family monovalent cation:H+ antiporter